MNETTRRYRKRKRAQSEHATRQRITEATVALHESVGPARTTIKAIAERAGVERATVYRHFPDEQALFDACTAHYFARHPMPDPERWRAIPPDERWRVALAELYAWYGESEQMLALGFRDIESVPRGTREAVRRYFEAVRAALVVGRPERGRARVRIAGAIGHAIAFGTWRSLTREQHLTDAEAIALLAAMVRSASERAAQRERRAA